MHVACHGEFDHAQPLKSRVRHAPRRGEEDGPAEEEPDSSAEETLGLDLAANLVTISACASGVSDRRPGDELIGLTRSLLYASAPSLLVGLWYAADGSTRLLMERFYAALSGRDGGEGGDKIEKAWALQVAQRHVMRTERFEHPYFWSPFVLIGDWQ